MRVDSRRCRGDPCGRPVHGRPFTNPVMSSRRASGVNTKGRPIGANIRAPAEPSLPLPACGERSEFALSSRKFRVRGPLRESQPAARSFCPPRVRRCGGAPPPRPSPRKRGEGAEDPGRSQGSKVDRIKKCSGVVPIHHHAHSARASASRSKVLRTPMSSKCSSRKRRAVRRPLLRSMRKKS